MTPRKLNYTGDPEVDVPNIVQALNYGEVIMPFPMQAVEIAVPDDEPLVVTYRRGAVTPRLQGRLADVQREIDLVRRGQAVAPQSILPPGVSGYNPAFKSEMSDYDPARANALLDMYGFLDRDGDGTRRPRPRARRRPPDVRRRDRPAAPPPRRRPPGRRHP